ncbi:MAG: hypothetical protein ACI4ES_06795 [Roseburia sp.]
MFEKKVTDAEKKRLEKEAKKAEKARRKEEAVKSGSAKEKALSIVKTLAIPTIIAAIIVCVIYVVVDSKASADELKTEVLCMVKDVPANTIVTADNVKDYFTVVSVDMAAVPDNAYKQLSDLPKDGFYIEKAMSKSQMVLKDDIATVDAILDKYKDGYEITSFKAPDFTRGVNGCIRKGDIVDVYAVDPTTDMLILLAEDVYVYEVYDSSGNKVTSKDEIATSFTVYVTEAEVENLNLAVCYGGIQMYLKTE